MKSAGFFSILFTCLILTAGCRSESMFIETGNVSEILSTTVHITGYLDCKGEGIKKYGHCISMDPDPEISDITTEFVSTIGTGEFTSVLYNLQPGTMYYARGYISTGSTVVYGNEINFTTR